MSQRLENKDTENEDDRNSDARGWDRDRVSIRLSAKRAAALRSLVADAPRATPTDAIDKAIELAREAARSPRGEPTDVESAGLEELERRLAGVFGSQFDELASVLSELRAKLDELRAAFVAALDSDGPHGSPAQPGRSADATMNETSIDLTAWLASSSLAKGLSLETSAVVRGRVVGARAIGDRGVVLDLSGELVAVDGAKAGSGDRGAPPLRLGPVAANSAAALVVGAEICLWCQRAGAEWQVKIHRVESDGRIGELVATHRA
jgi:hypothetical protein